MKRTRAFLAWTVLGLFGAMVVFRCTYDREFLINLVSWVASILITLALFEVTGLTAWALKQWEAI